MSNHPTRRELASAMRSALLDDDAHSARQELCRAVASALTESGRRLWVGGWLLRNPTMEGIAILTEMAAELATGAVASFEGERWYAGACLVRQLVEAEYFFWKFASDSKAPVQWLNAQPEDIRKEFAPAKLRKQSGGIFRDKEYWTHCDLGGHPNPRARILLKDHSDPIGTKRAGWADLAQHLERLWSFFIKVLDGVGAADVVTDGILNPVAFALGEWHDRDPLATRLPVSWFEPDESA